MAVNRVVFDGNLTRDAKLSAYREDGHVLNFTVAISEQTRDENGEWVDAPVFVRCALFGSRAEKLAKALTKGVRVCVDGKLRYNSYMKDDERRSYLSVVVDRIDLLTPRKDRKGAAEAEVATEDAIVPSGAHMAAPEAEVYDDDIPF